MDKRKLFSEIEQTWYFKKLFSGLGQYNYKSNGQPYINKSVSYSARSVNFTSNI